MHWWRCPEAHSRIEIVHSELRCTTVRIGNPGFHTNTIPRLEIGDFRSYLQDHARSLMTENHRLPYDEGSDCAMLIVMNIASADADGTQPDAYVMGPERLVDGEFPQ